MKGPWHPSPREFSREIEKDWVQVCEQSETTSCDRLASCEKAREEKNYK